MHYRRVQVMEKLRELGKDIWWLTSDTVKKLYWWGGGQRCQGILFISHLGEIYSSGFRQISAGNVRRDPIVKIYRNSVLFKSLPDLKGKFGGCPFNVICGGYRARAYGVTGDHLAVEPFCIFQPAAA